MPVSSLALLGAVGVGALVGGLTTHYVIDQKDDDNGDEAMHEVLNDTATCLVGLPDCS